MTYNAIEFPGVDFPTQKELFDAIAENSNEIIALKKKATFKGFEKHQVSVLGMPYKELNSTKAVSVPFEVKEDFIYPVISTTNYMDSHNDVHFNGCFNRTVSHQKGKVMYCTDHELKLSSIVSLQPHTEMFVSDIPWGLVGKDFIGNTQGLTFAIDKANVRIADILEIIEKQWMQFENSIRMIYKDIRVGINSTDKDLAAQKRYWDSRINSIVNKEKAMELGYFYGVEELSIDREGSLVVAGGSNDATSIITLELVNGTSKAIPAGPVNTTSQKSVYDFLI